MTASSTIAKLDLNLLKVFESIYQQQNMSRTAEELHITPSAVSHALKRLRECLDDPLFVRSKHKMLPTPACQQMAPQIIDNLARLRQILQHWGKFQPQTSEHHFRLGIHDALEPSILPKLAKRLIKLAPNTTLSSVKVKREHLARELAAGHLDMAFDVALPLKPPVFHLKLIEDEFCVLLRKGHPLANQLTQHSYFAAKHISVSNRASGAAVEDLLFQQQGLARQVAVRCQNYYAARAMLLESDLLLTLPFLLGKELMSGHGAEQQMVMTEIPVKMTKIETHLYWHQNTHQDEAQCWLRDIVQSLMI